MSTQLVELQMQAHRAHRARQARKRKAAEDLAARQREQVRKAMADQAEKRSEKLKLIADNGIREKLTTQPLSKEPVEYDAHVMRWQQAKKKTFADIKREVLLTQCPFEWDELIADRRQKDLVVWRQAICEACTRYLPHSLPQIGRLMGGRDHTTIIHSRDKVKQALADGLVNEVRSPAGFVFYVRKINP